MMKAVGIVIGNALVLAGGVGRAAQPSSTVRLSVLYDNTAAVEGVEPDWGFACLVETPGARVLFDTGTEPERLRSNAAKLGVDLGNLTALVLSHEHHDHIGGLPALPRPQAPIPLYVPASFSAGFEEQATAAGWRVVRSGAPAVVADGVRVTGEIDGPVREQALVVDTAAGALVLTGCAHPGVVEIVRRVKRGMQTEPATVLGGFHLLRAPIAEVRQVIDELRSLGVARVGATHCTGDEAIAEFRRAFGDHFVALGVGATVEMSLPAPAS